MPSVRVLIVDDSRLARLELKEQLKKIGGIDLITEAANTRDALQIITEHQPDVLLLDINMPGGDGFSLLEQLDSLPYVIFVTAYEEYALKSFDFNATDYLLKPVTTERLSRALNKITGFEKEQQLSLQADCQVFVKDGERCFLVQVADIIACEAIGNYCKVIINGHERHHAPLIYKNLSQLEKRLPARYFFRANRSWIINTRFIADIELSPGNGLIFQLTNNLSVDVSRLQSVQFRQRWGL
ncbi:LytR/AlgR family response regulator transcription factor [Lacimicrobium alkaliphilum]|uniref:LytR/AlgR family response regulator transcription factor n=1 Tax=Lacimicrobium alkaliphilum TaxID=1526571 RepID=UPI001E38D7BC|nr:LytTR family DNA-binding domain-containing protein [Lacimicrobium alkaliphilum]